MNYSFDASPQTAKFLKDNEVELCGQLEELAAVVDHPAIKPQFDRLRKNQKGGVSFLSIATMDY